MVYNTASQGYLLNLCAVLQLTSTDPKISLEIRTKFSVVFGTSDYRVDEWDVTFEISTADLRRCEFYPISCEFLQARLEK